MEPKAKTMETPAGIFQAPMNPAFKTHLAKCQTETDLFELVEHHGFINPDAFNEVTARGLYFRYKEWKQQQNSIQPQ